MASKIPMIFVFFFLDAYSWEKLLNHISEWASIQQASARMIYDEIHVRSILRTLSNNSSFLALQLWAIQSPSICAQPKNKTCSTTLRPNPSPSGEWTKIPRKLGGVLGSFWSLTAEEDIINSHFKESAEPEAWTPWTAIGPAVDQMTSSLLLLYMYI